MKAILTLLILCGLAATTLAQSTLIPYRKGLKWGYVTPQMKHVVPFLYDDAYPLIEGLARVRQGKHYGFINAKGRLVIPCVYDQASDYNQVYDPLREITTTKATVVKAGKRFAILPNGNHVKPPGYLVPDVGIDKLVLTKTDSLRVTDLPDGRKQLERQSGGIPIGPFREVYIEIVADPITGHYSSDKGPRYVVAGQTPAGWELYSANGKRLTTASFDDVTITPLMVIVQKSGRFGALNAMTGDVRVPIRYDSLYYRMCGEHCHSYLIKENGKWGTLNTGAWTVPIEYDDLQLLLSNQEKAVFITRKGKLYGLSGPDGTLSPRYESMEKATDDLLRVKLNGRYGYIDLAGTHYFDD